MERMLVKVSKFILACILFFPVAAIAVPIQKKGTDYGRLLDFISIEDLEEPLVLFKEDEGDFDQKLNYENIEYLNKNRSLLKNIKTKLNEGELKWKLGSCSKRLYVVPEKRDEYAELFESYCQDAVAYLLQKFNAPNPYTKITTLEGEKGDLGNIERQMGNIERQISNIGRQNGITAYLVHNVANEYVEEFVFFTKQNEKNKIKIKMSNRVFTGIIGSYTSNLIIDDEQRFEFEKETYTVWQNSAKDPMNVFIVPVEETLHILFRDSTESAIRDHLRSIEPQKVKEVEQVINEWMAVEEAIVGGIVSLVLPELFDNFVNNISKDELLESLAERKNFQQYRYLSKAIDVVSKLGAAECYKLYQNNPEQFRLMTKGIEIGLASNN
ncbi:MAG: hypothetical protein GY874_04825 [Desulfobacteraceae bacterium]|nr:hypothetical protein [Desulfobacteraceae bacterium]